jgi:hypothetical protein
MKQVLIVLLVGFAVYCFVGAITDSFSFATGGPDGQDHAIGNTLWAISGLATLIVAGAVAYFFSKNKEVA